MNKIQIYGYLGADPEIRIKKSGAMMATFVLKSPSSWQAALGEWQYRTNWHHVTVYNEFLIQGLDESLKKGRLQKGHYLFVQGTLVYEEDNEESARRKKKTQIVVSRKEGRIFQLLLNSDLIKKKLPLLFTTEEPNENKPQKSIDETE